MERREAIRRTAYLIGGTISVPALASVLKGCTPAGPSWKPTFLSPEQGETVMEVAETILPKTSTPGAIEVGVHEFIDQALKECYSKEDQDTFLSGITAFMEECESKYGNSYKNLTSEEKAEIVSQYDANAAKEFKARHARSTFRTFFMMLKELTMVGYFTSEVGASQVLKYVAIPGDWKGCIPYEEVGGAWAT